MSEEEQDEGTRRASELGAMASRQYSDEIIMQLLDGALREFDELGLVEVDSSEEDYDWGGSVTGSDGGGSDEEFARDLQKTLSAERRTTQQPEPEPEPEGTVTVGISQGIPARPL
eukprot:COSAG06_NODE_22258_length_729_cov_1.649206_1_plen_115_part_00